MGAHQVCPSFVMSVIVPLPDFSTVCEPCQKRSRGTGCTWDTSPAKINAQIPPDRIKWLEDRIRQLEQGSLGPDANRTSSRERLDDCFQPRVPESDLMPYATSMQTDKQLSLDLTSDGQLTSIYAPEESLQPKRPEPILSPVSRPSTQQQSGSSNVDGVSPSETRSVHGVIGTTMNNDRREGFFGSASAGSFVCPYFYAFSHCLVKLIKCVSRCRT